MTKMRITATVAVLGALGGGLWFYQHADAAEAPAFRLAAVERGDVSATVSATGSLGAVRTVQVGTQVSGQVAALYADFNDRVTKGQLLARIDPTLQEQAVAEAQAAVERAQAQYAAAKAEYDRNKQLFDAQIVTASEFGSVESNFAVARSNVRSAQISLDRARQNLSYTAIYAPIDGVIVSRDVDVGQTVAASLSAPQLFAIAQDLTAMQILASVDEADIGRIAEGQPVTFTVTAYQDREFTGTVEQVRLQSATTENVVSYTVVVSVQNPEGVLLPGMTATVRFLTATADDVLSVPNAALRFQPTAEMMAERSAGAGEGTARGSAPDSAARAAMRAAMRERGARGGAAAGGSAARASAATLWRVNAAGRVEPVRVRTGLSDGQRTEVQGPALEEGMQVVTGTSSAQPASAAAASPFQQQGGGGGGRRPPGAF